MVRFFRYFLVALVFAVATIGYYHVSAQSTGPATSPLASPTKTAGVTLTATQTPPSPSTLGGAVLSASLAAASATVTDTDSTSNVPLPTPTLLPLIVQTSTQTSTQSSPITSTLAPATTAGPLEGTILANRATTIARFFLEGETYLLEAARSQGINLPRATSVLSLFNCAGDLTDETAGCFWDPYLIEQDGFYEIYDASTTGDPAKLMLREAGAPPTGTVWVQNRTGQAESVVFKEDVYEIQPTSVQEFPVSTGVPAILYVRSCLTIDNQSACEWAPKTLDAGVYYAMVEVDTPGSQSGSTRATIDLRPVVGDSQEPATAEVSSSAASIVCNVVVPALNVRSGPGLQYEIIGKVRTTDGSAVMVNVTGRSDDNEWLTVDPTVAENGWINNSPSFITCSGDVLSLPVAEVPATPTPQPEVVDETPAVVDTTTTDSGSNTVPDVVATSEPEIVQQSAPPVEDTPIEETTTVTPTDAAPAVPQGQAMLVVNNGFAHDIRFTLDQMYRVVEGPSEFDLKPGDTLNILVYPGQVPFTASSPWSGLSGNASVHVESEQSLPLWLRFEPQQGGSWDFHWD